MGFTDKLKGLFKKKDKAPAAKKEKAAAGKESGADRSLEFKGDDKVSESLRFAARKIDEREAAGKIDDKRAEMFMGQLKAIQASDASEDAKETQISQVIGGIIKA